MGRANASQKDRSLGPRLGCRRGDIVPPSLLRPRCGKGCRGSGRMEVGERGARHEIEARRADCSVSASRCERRTRRGAARCVRGRAL
jgi:hypothetical protein